MNKIALLISFVAYIPCYAQGGSPDNGSDVPVCINPKPLPPSQRPHTPDNQYIDCWYDGANLNFNFMVGEGNCQMTLTEFDNCKISTYSFDSSVPVQIYVGEIWNASIVIDTSKGNSYEGYLGD